MNRYFRHIIPLLFGVLLSASCFAHDFYVSVAILDYNEENKSIEITFKFTAHDIEKSFNDQYFGDLKLGAKNEHSKADSLLFQYITQHFNLEVGGKTLSPTYIGKEINLDESLFVYLEIPNVKNPKNFILTNDLLTETFVKQENINHINFGKEQLTVAFNKDQFTKEITLE